MSFLFATSHLPEAERTEDEDEEEQPQMPRRSGTVRAFSHLPLARGMANSSGPATPVGRPRPYPGPDDDQDTAHAPEPDSDHDDDTGPHEPEDSRPWYMPRISAQDLPRQDHDEDAHAQEERDHPDPSTLRDSKRLRSSGFTPSPQDLRDAFHSPAPDSPMGQDSSQDTRPTLPQSRLFEQRNTPEAFLIKAAIGPSSQQRILGSRQAIATQQQGHGANPAAQEQSGKPATQPKALAQAQRPAAKPAQNAPAAPQARTGQVAEEKKPGSYASDQRIKIDAPDPRFEAAARAAMADEAANSPVAAALLKEAVRLGFSIVPQKGLRMSETKSDQDGRPVIHFNPFMKTDTTMSHEIAHVIQMTAFQKVIDDVKKAGKKPDARDIQRATQAGRDALSKIVPVQSDKDLGQDYKENDAMRVAHIVGAERTASEMKDLPEDQKTLEEFLRRQAEKEKARGEPEKGRKHPNNDYPIPPGTERGNYDYQYVRDILGLDEQGRKKARPEDPAQNAPRLTLPPPPPLPLPPPSPLPQAQPTQPPLPPPQPLG